jgi:hypothetical protein
MTALGTTALPNQTVASQQGFRGWLQMKAVDAHGRSLAGLARSVRAAIVVPSLFALALLGIKQPELAGFAVFGTFAHLVMIDYDTAGRARSAQCAILTLLGAIMVTLGILASVSIWLAPIGALAAGFLTELIPLFSSRLAAIRTALLLSFMLAVAMPAPTHFVFPYLAGWLLAGIVAQPALLLIWIPLQGLGAAEGTATSHETVARPIAPVRCSAWTGNAAGSGMAMALAVLLARFLKVDHAFWVVLGILPVLSANLTSAAQKFWQEQMGTLIGFLVGAFVVTAIGVHQLWYWLILPLVVLGSTYAASAIGFMAGQAAFTVFAVVLFCILLPQQGEIGILRVEDVAIGGAVSLLVGSLRQLGRPDLWTRRVKLAASVNGSPRLSTLV